MNNKTRNKLKDITKKKPLNTAILTTPEYDRGYSQAVDDAIRSLKSKLGNSNSAGHDRVFLTEVFTELEKLKK